MHRDDAAPIRSILFVPGSEPEEVAASVGLGSDAVILDLEEPREPFSDAQRTVAGEQVGAFLRSLPADHGRPLYFVRVRSPRTGLMFRDLRPGGRRAPHRRPGAQDRRPRRRRRRRRGPHRGRGRGRARARVDGDLPDPRDRRGPPERLRDRRGVSPRRLPRRAPSPASATSARQRRLPLDRRGDRDALPALQGAHRRQGGRASGTRSAACGAGQTDDVDGFLRFATELRDLGYPG